MSRLASAISLNVLLKAGRETSITLRDVPRRDGPDANVGTARRRQSCRDARSICNVPRVAGLVRRSRRNPNTSRTRELMHGWSLETAHGTSVKLASL